MFGIKRKIFIVCDVLVVLLVWNWDIYAILRYYDNSIELECNVCKKGYFNANDDNVSMCRPCQRCFGQIILVKCTQERDSGCGGCKENYEFDPVLNICLLVHARKTDFKKKNNTIGSDGYDNNNDEESRSHVVFVKVIFYYFVIMGIICIVVLFLVFVCKRTA